MKKVIIFLIQLNLWKAFGHNNTLIHIKICSISNTYVLVFILKYEFKLKQNIGKIQLLWSSR